MPNRALMESTTINAIAILDGKVIFYYLFLLYLV